MCHLTNLSFPLFAANCIEEEAKHQPKKEEGEPKIAVVRGGAEGAGVLREHERQQGRRLRPDVHQRRFGGMDCERARIPCPPRGRRLPGCLYFMVS